MDPKLFITLAIVPLVLAQLGEKCVPSPDPNNPNYIKHQTNCSKFLSCGSGLYLEMECPARLHFNAEKKICDWPKDAGCTSSNNNKFPPVVDPIANSTAWPGNKCVQSTHRNNPRLAPYENNCDKFLICTGIWSIMNCPTSLQFSVETGHCEHPHNVRCASTATTAIQPQCTREGERSMHPMNCRKFYVCRSGMLIETICPDGLLFSEASSECLPERGSSCGPLLTTPAFDSLPACNIEGVLFPNYEDCKKFFICNGGTLVSQSCPPHKFFSVRHNNCQVKIVAVCAAATKKQ